MSIALDAFEGFAVWWSASLPSYKLLTMPTRFRLQRQCIAFTVNYKRSTCTTSLCRYLLKLFKDFVFPLSYWRLDTVRKVSFAIVKAKIIKLAPPVVARCWKATNKSVTRLRNAAKDCDFGTDTDNQIRDAALNKCTSTYTKRKSLEESQGLNF